MAVLIRGKNGRDSIICESSQKFEKSNPTRISVFFQGRLSDQMTMNFETEEACEEAFESIKVAFVKEAPKKEVVKKEAPKKTVVKKEVPKKV